MAYDIGLPEPPAVDPDLLRRIMPMPVLRPQPEATPDGHWEGRIKGASGSARRADFTVRAALVFSGAEVHGTGKSPEFPYNEPGCRDFEVTGQVCADKVSIEILFAGGY